MERRFVCFEVIIITLFIHGVHTRSRQFTCGKSISSICVSLVFSSRTRGPFLKSPGNLPGPISVFRDKYFLTEVNFC